LSGTQPSGVLAIGPECLQWITAADTDCMMTDCYLAVTILKHDSLSKW